MTNYFWLGNGQRTPEIDLHQNTFTVSQRYPSTIAPSIMMGIGLDGLNPSYEIHSITLSARSSIVSGILMPSAFAVFMLKINSSLVGCSIGRSPGLAPLNILST